uniref:Uncharacterized protein n=1 Tax=Solanum tuberosum TaxID=4113 RepID=M1ATV6_SOLTU
MGVDDTRSSGFQGPLEPYRTPHKGQCTSCRWTIATYNCSVSTFKGGEALKQKKIALG